MVVPGNLFVNAIRITKYPEGKKAQGKFSIEKNEVRSNLVQSGVDWNMKQNIGLKYKQQQTMPFDIVILDEKNTQVGNTEIDIVKLFQ